MALSRHRPWRRRESAGVDQTKVGSLVEAAMEFRVLGPLEVRSGDDVVQLRGARQKALLAILLLSVNNVVSSARLIDELWNESPPESGAHALRVRVSELRKTLATVGLEQTIQTRAPGYVILLRRDQLDLSTFEDLLEGGAAALDDGDMLRASNELRSALALWRGPALGGVENERFGQAAAVRLEELRLHALELRIEAELRLGWHEQLAGELLSLVDEHPLNERLRGQLMRALYASGRQSEALEAYRNGRELLVTELGIEPGPALQALESEILRQDPSLAAGQPPDGADAAPTPERSVLILPSGDAALDTLLPLAEPMAKTPAHELILLRLVEDEAELSAAVPCVHERRDSLVEQGLAARAAAFTSTDRGADAVQLAREQAVALMLADLEPVQDKQGRLSPEQRSLLDDAPCDVALLVNRSQPLVFDASRPVVVPFGAADYDWAAAELAAWIVNATGSPLLLAGVGKRVGGHGRDASQLLARASLLLQKALGIAAEPMLVDEGAEALVEAVDSAALVVAGISSQEGRRELGAVRVALVEHATPPVLLLREGLRPSGLAPSHTMTRYTWSMTRA